MNTVREIAALRQQLAEWRRRGERVALVPTMGNLHAGHVALIDLAKAHADHVVVSIFVNPMQFDHQEEVAKYPRTFEADCDKLLASGVDLLFFPEIATIYPQGSEHSARIELPGLTEILCGAFRPGHFTGVLTVVAKLFNLVQPDVAVFGEKDYQQLQVIRRLVADLNMPVEIIAGATMREVDGLAMSSRNNYLSPQERRTAPLLQQVLQATAQCLLAGERDWPTLEVTAMQDLRAAGFAPDYVRILSAADLGEPGELPVEQLIVLAAAWLGAARLIDNLPLATVVNSPV